jgi:hypothetical protein
MGIVELVVLVVVVAGIVIAFFGWDRYRGSRNRATGSSAAQPTDEVFIDPDTGQRMRVWYDASTGHREYRPE